MELMEAHDPSALVVTTELVQPELQLRSPEARRRGEARRPACPERRLLPACLARWSRAIPQGTSQTASTSPHTQIYTAQHRTNTSGPFLFSSPPSLSLRLPNPPGHLPFLYCPPLPPRDPVDRPLLPSQTPREGRCHRLAGGRGPRSYGQKARMPAQKRRLPSPSSKPRDHVEANGTAAASTGGGGGQGGGIPPVPGGGAAKRVTDPQPRCEGDSDAEGGGGADGDSESSQSDGDMDEFILVKLAEIRKEVQCPICLSIIRKTRTVMECLHRFCRDCIDKSMRLGNNECPACRTHCASRRSLRDDPNYDALIAALYPDIDKYEEEELAFSEEEKSRNKKIQATIEETFRRQSEAISKNRSTAAFGRKYRRNVRARGRGKTITPDNAPNGSDDEDREEGNANDASKESSSADDHSPDLRQKRGRKRPAARSSPSRTTGSSDHGFEENGELLGGKENFTTSPLRGEMLAWGKNGTRSQTRHGNAGGSNGRVAKGGRIAKLVDHFRTTDEMDKEFNVYLVLIPLDGQRTPNLEKPYLSCRPTLSIRHLVQFVALQLSRHVEELEIYIRMSFYGRSVARKDSSTGEAKMQMFDGLERLREDKLLSELHPSFASGHGDLELLYALKTHD